MSDAPVDANRSGVERPTERQAERNRILDRLTNAGTTESHELLGIRTSAKVSESWPLECAVCPDLIEVGDYVYDCDFGIGAVHAACAD